MEFNTSYSQILTNPFAIVSHDAGGAEILSSYVRRQGLACIYVLEGPARKIFERKLGSIEILSLEDAIRSASSVLCGTSWPSDLEYNAIKLARASGKHSIAFLDHWVNYRERFIRSGETCLPDEIWVGDAVAASMAKEIFQTLPVHQVENPYFQDICQELAAIPKKSLSPSDGISVLYICEPIRTHALQQFGDERHWGYVEEDALRYFLSNIASLGRQVKRILIRPHPSEPGDKYNWARNEFNLPIIQGGVRTLLEEMVDCDVVVGCESMAMVIGLLAGKRVISSIPPGGRACVLPQKEIESFQRILSGVKPIAESLPRL